MSKGSGIMDLNGELNKKDFLREHISTQVINSNGYKLGLSTYQIHSNKFLNKDSIRLINMADFHTIEHLSKSKLFAIKSYLESQKGRLSFITITGDIESGNKLLKDRGFIKKTFDEFSALAGNIPLFLIPGNHDFGILMNTGTEKVLEIFKGFKTDNVIPLINDVFDYNEFTKLYGIAYGCDGYLVKGITSSNPKYLLKQLENNFLPLDSNKFNISLVHDCFAAYHSQFFSSTGISLKDFDLVLAGHGHGGCNDYHRLCDTSKYYNGPTDYIIRKQFKDKPITSYGLYPLDLKTALIVTEGVTRFNGWLPQFIPTIPFISVITVDGDKEKVLQKRL